MQQGLKTKPTHEFIDLGGAILPRTNLSHADLTGANLERANLSGTDCSYAIFAHTNMLETVLQAADLRHANFSHADARRADFSRAQLEGAVFHQTNLEQAKFVRTDLRGIDFSSAISLTWASLIDGLFDQSTELPDYLDVNQLTPFLTQVYSSLNWPDLETLNRDEVVKALSILVESSEETESISNMLTRLELHMRQSKELPEK